MPDPWDMSLDNIDYAYSDEAFARRDEYVRVTSRRLGYVLAYFFLFVAQTFVMSYRHGFVPLPFLLAFGLLSSPAYFGLQRWLDAPEAR